MARKSEVKIVYQERENRPMLPVHGAYGGLSSDRGSVVAHVYAEFGTIPSIMTADVDEDGTVDLEAASMIKRGDAIRDVLATLVMSPETAVSVGKWLIEKGESAMKSRSGRGRQK